MLCIKFTYLTTSPHSSSLHSITPSPLNSSILFSLMSSFSKTSRDYSRKHRRAILEPWRQHHNLPSSPPSPPPHRTPPTSLITTNSLSSSSPSQNLIQNQIVHDLNELYHLSNLLDINLQQAIKATNPSPPTSPYFEEMVGEGKIYGLRDIERFREAVLYLDTAGALQFQLGEGDISAYWRGISSEGDFLSTASSYTAIRDPMPRLYHRLIVCNIVGRSQAPEKVASRPKRQPDAAAGAPKVVEGASDIDEGAQAVPTLIQAPPAAPLELDQLGLYHRGWID
ncbi:hypothetical protein Tco_0290640 [Tanacetum coccineum]